MSDRRQRRNPGTGPAAIQPVDICLGLLLLLAPLFMGGRHPVGQLVFVALIGLAVVVGLIQRHANRQPWRSTTGQWILLAGLLVLVLQLTPLPADLLASISPGIADSLPLWMSADASQELGTWQLVSLTPAATRDGLVLYLAYGMLFVLLVQSLNDLDDIQRLLKLAAIATVAMAAVGLMQYLFGNDRFLWIYEHPSRLASGAVKGPFSNENHFAHFLALGVGPLLWWVHQAFRRSDRGGFTSASKASASRHSEERGLWLALGLGVVVFAGLLTYSRGGVLILALAALICLSLYAVRSLLRANQVIGFGALVAVIGLALAIHGYTPLAGQLATLQFDGPRDLPRLMGRQQIWTADAHAIANSPSLGTGVGSHREVYPIYIDGVTDVEYTHAESGYLQVLVETGLAGGILLVSALALCAFWCFNSIRRSQSTEHSSAAIALTASLAVSALHSIWDFVWYIPACMTLTIFLAAAACRLSAIVAGKAPTSHDPLTVPPLWRRLAVVPVTAVIGLMAWSQVSPALGAVHWDQYLRDRQALTVDAGAANQVLSSEEQFDRNARLLTHLTATIRHQPDHSRAHLRAAGLSLVQFDLAQQNAVNAMPISAIRDAAQSSSFPSPTERDQWLTAVLAENRQHLDSALYHARHAVRLCPLQGEAYVYWSETAFLEKDSASLEVELIEQALALRPTSGHVLLAAGSSAISSGDLETGLHYWKAVFAAEPDLQIQLFEALRPYTSAEFLLTELQPDLEATRRLAAYYGTTDSPAVDQAVRGYYAALLERNAAEETGQAAANLWHKAQGVHHSLEDRQRAAACAQQAVLHAPDDLTIRRAAAARLVEAGHFEAALEHLTVCQRFNPHDQQLAEFIASVESRAWEQRQLRNVGHSEDDNSRLR